VRFAAAFLLERADGALLFRRRPLDGLLGGMAELPSTAWLDEPASAKAIAAAAPASAEWRPVPGEAVHGFTHFELRFKLLRAKVEQGPAGLWVRPDEFGTLALPTMTLRLLRHAGLDVRRSGPPDVRQVQRPAPGRDGDQVEALGEAGEPRLALEEVGGGAGDSLLLVPPDRLERCGGAGAALDLHEQEEVVAAGDQVDLADVAGEAPGQDAEALEAQVEGRDRLGAPPRPLAAAPAHPRRRAKARR